MIYYCVILFTIYTLFFLYPKHYPNYGTIQKTLFMNLMVEIYLKKRLAYFLLYLIKKAKDLTNIENKLKFQHPFRSQQLKTRRP